MQKILISFILLLSSGVVLSQAGFVNNGNLQIHTGADMTAFIDFTNASTAGLVNNGTFYLKANVTNNRTAMNPGTGATIFNGTTAQSVNGSEPYRVYNVTTNNNNGITLNNDLSINAAHTFTLGIITSSSTPNYLIYENGSSYSGSADNAHVNGWVRKTGATNFIFPVGNATLIRPIAVNNLSAASTFNAQYAGVTTNTGNVLPNLVTVDPYEYWFVNKVSGGTAQVDMNWNNSKVTFPNYMLASIRVANYTGGMWTNTGGTATGNVTTTGTITSPSVSTFGAFTFGSLNFSLPLNFISITANRKYNYSLVQWKTVEEYNVDHFEVQRKDSRNPVFFVIATVPANNNMSNAYEIEDDLPLDGTAFYRVRSVDRDGQYGYSKIASVSDRGNGAMAVINNPARNTIFISVNNIPKGNYICQLIDGSGKIVQAKQIFLDGQSVIDIPVSIKASKGFYLVKVRNNLFEFSDKVIIQ
ncbi:MAG TPA: T9SS type A sorting domain-containing protein [Flavitalea sp.]|nr:T9SS type A sorting domain-containing protein [Flavitalea sp.]